MNDDNNQTIIIWILSSWSIDWLLLSINVLNKKDWIVESKNVYVNDYSPNFSTWPLSIDGHQ